MSPPSGTCGLTPRTEFRLVQRQTSRFKGSERNGRAGVGARPSPSTRWLTPPLNTRFSAELRKGSAKRLPQLALSRNLRGIALRVCGRKGQLEISGADFPAHRS